MSYRSLRRLAATFVAGVAFTAAPAAEAGRAVLKIPRLGVSEPVNFRSANLGPHLYYQDNDTVGIAGHRTTYQREFAGIHTLRRGDRVQLGRWRYRVTRSTIIRPWETWVLNFRGIVLSACTPPGSAAYRWVVFAARA